MRRKINEKALLEGSIPRHVLRLALPMIIAFTFITSYNFADRYFVSQLGDIATAAIGMAFLVQLIIISIGSGLGIGINSYISRKLGEKDAASAQSGVRHALLMALIFGGIIAVVGLLIQHPLYRFLGAKGQLLTDITEYLTILFIFTPLNLFTMFSSNIFQGWGDTVTPMRFMLAGVLLNLFLDPLFIFGFGQVPEMGGLGAFFNLFPDPLALLGLGAIPAMGVKGAACATVVSRLLTFSYVLYEFLIRHRPMKLSFKGFKFNPAIIRGIFQVGLPSALSQILTSCAMGLIFFMLRPYGDSARAAYTIVFTYEMIVFLPAIGIAQAVTILTGHNFGARQFDRVRQTFRAGSAISLGIMGFLAGIILLNVSGFADIFAESREVRNIGATAMQFTLVGLVFLSVYMCSVASFQGLGLGRHYLQANILRLVGLLLPVTYAGSLIYGLNGIWAGMMLVNIISALALFIWHQYILKSLIASGEAPAT